MSRIPRPSAAPKASTSPTHNALNDRSESEIDVHLTGQLSPRTPRLEKGTHATREARSVSVSTSASVVHNTVQRKSSSGSPSKDTDSVPEWRRRLVNGELPYGETKDLFSTAGTGLEDMFRPPMDPELAANQSQEELSAIHDMTLPSSPPPYRKRGYIATEEDPRNQSSNFASSKTSSGTGPERNPVESTVGSSKNHFKTSSGIAQSSETSLSADPESQTRRIISGASGQSVIQHEDLSPIVLTRHDSASGKFTYAPLDATTDQLKKRLNKLRRNQEVLYEGPFDSIRKPSGRGGPAGVETGEYNNTDDFIKSGGFLNVKRGSRSAEGSFRVRPLSPPSIVNDSSEMLPESSLQASTPKQFPTTRTDWRASGSRDEDEDYDDWERPSTADQFRATQQDSVAKAQHGASQSTSPLKLFGPYDTFTNQTLLRRISQFEDPMSDSPSQLDDADRPSSRDRPASSRHHDGTPHRKSLFSRGSRGATNAFGVGELNDFEFSEAVSLSDEPSLLKNKENMDPSRDTVSQGTLFRFDIHEDLHSDSEFLPTDALRKRSTSSTGDRGSRQSSWGSHVRRSRASSAFGSVNKALLSTPQRESSEGKRPRTSPSKDPTPKRRRTLHKSDVAFGLIDFPEDFDLAHKSNEDQQDAVGRKRKTPQSRDGQLSLNPAISALRQTARPRSPTPSQRNSAVKARPPLEEVQLAHEEYEDVSFGDDIADVTLDSILGVSRKTSMKTQDFWDQANEIMAMIRNKARPKTSLDSVEESEVEHVSQTPLESAINDDDASYQSTEEPFSRPPSREGRPVARIPPRQEDPELADRLKQYAELSDLGELVSLSMGRIKEANHDFNIAKQAIDQSLKESASRGFSSPGPDFVSDLPGVRFSRNPDEPASPSRHSRVPSGLSQDSHASSSRSFPSGSSRNSESRRLIAPDAVTQLIGDQVGNMIFDKTKNAWMKVKTPTPLAKTVNITPADDSEEDPFASIPDLSVDMTREKENLLGLSGGTQSTDAGSGADFLETSQLAAESQFDIGTPSRDRSPDLSPRVSPRSPYSRDLADEDETVEHEITIDEDRVSQTPPSRRRNLTITFSSPIASIIRNLPALDDDNLGMDPLELSEAVRETTSAYVARHRNDGDNAEDESQHPKPRSRSRSRGPARKLSVRGRAFLTRPVSRIDERDEIDDDSCIDERQLSIIPDLSLAASDADEEHRSALDVAWTPAANRAVSISATPAIAKHVGMLSLSPLSDFTMLKADQSCALEVSYVVEDQYLVSGNGSKKVLSKAIRNLVEKITEVEPFEPDWQGMRELDVSDKKLASLHMLDEFCGGVVTLEASNNSIRHLEGVPECVRNLRITHNQLSELTAWGHLLNLQYVDVSNNNLTSLHAFQELVHLRNLRADNNKITSLQGICYHDTLQVLRARGNQIDFVDFDGSTLDRLSELDLENNCIESIHNVDQLPCLTSLNLQHNQLTEISTRTGTTTESLRYLKLSDNNISSLDLASFPSVRLLHADQNRIGVVTGGSRCRRLDSLSLREQRNEGRMDTTFLTEIYEVRKLFLSGNLLDGFYPLADFLNLQYLELANCGLESLPSNLGQLMPNVRVLNLNFNALEDLAPLRFIPRLKKLAVAGNRLAEAGQVANILAEFPHLVKLDLRDNPTTLGFYPPLQTLVYVDQDDERAFDPFVLPDGNAERDGQFLARLDTGTRMRRRLYEMVVLGRCPRLKSLDGLVACRAEVAKKDAVWHALNKTGVLRGVGLGTEEKGQHDSTPEQCELPPLPRRHDAAANIDLPYRPSTPV